MRKIFPLIALILFVSLTVVPVSANSDDTQIKDKMLDFYSNDLNRTVLDVTSTANTVDAVTGEVKNGIIVDGIVTESEKGVYTEYALRGSPNFYSNEHLKPSLSQMTPNETQKELIDKLSSDLKIWFAQDDRHIYIAFYELGNEWDDQYKENSDQKELADGEPTDASLVMPDDDTDKGNGKNEFTSTNDYGIRIGFDIENYNKYLYYGNSIPCGISDLKFSFYTDDSMSFTHQVALRVAREQRYYEQGEDDFTSETGRFIGTAKNKRYHAYTEIAIDKALMSNLFGVEDASTLLFSLGTRSYASCNSTDQNERHTYSMGGDCVWLGNYLDSDKLLSLNDKTGGEYSYNVFPDIITFGAPTPTSSIMYALPEAWSQKRHKISSPSEKGNIIADGTISEEELALYHLVKYDKADLIRLEGMLGDASCIPLGADATADAELSKLLGDFEFYFAYDEDKLYFAYKKVGARHDVDIVIGFIIDGVSCNFLFSHGEEADPSIFLHTSMNSQYLYNTQKLRWQRTDLLLSEGSGIVEVAEGQNGEGTDAKYTEMSLNKSALLELLTHTHSLSEDATLPSSMMLSVSARPYTDTQTPSDESALLFGTVLGDADKIAVNDGMAILPEVITFGSAQCSDGCVYTNIVNKDYLIEAATCTVGNKYYKSCAVCSSYSLDDTFTDASSVLPHTYDRQITDTKYLVSAATCTDKGVYYKSCVCGEFSKTESQTFETQTDPLAHSFADEYSFDLAKHWFACSKCGAKDGVEPHVYIGTLAIKCSVCKATTATPPSPVIIIPETTEVEETTTPEETSIPIETTAPAQTTSPTETTVPEQTSSPTTEQMTESPESATEPQSEVYTELYSESTSEDSPSGSCGGCREQISISGLSLIALTLLAVCSVCSKGEEE